MNTPFFIAKRYLFSKKSQNVINIISGISVFGISIATAAMILVLSAFNGIEGLVHTLFTSFEPDLKIESIQSKTFSSQLIPNDFFDDETILYHSNIIEETVIFKNYEQFTFGKIKGVEPDFLKMVKMPNYLLDSANGFSGLDLNYKNQAFGISGFILFQNLGGYIYDIPGEYEYLTIFSPKRNQKIKRNGSSGFEKTIIPIGGIFSYNNKIDESYTLVPLDYAASILGYENHISSIEIKYKEHIDVDSKKRLLQEVLGEDFSVKTNYEQNELIYKTSQSEKWLTIILLGFIFFLGTFTMVASITMLIIEKKENINTLFAFGAEQNSIKNIFFYEGLLINFIGIIIGISIGLIIYYLQINYGLLKMEGGMVENFPVLLKVSDIFLILGITAIIGTITAYLPSKILIKLK